MLRQLESGALTSVWAPRAGVVRYRQDRWTRPRKGCGPLAVFRRIKSAQKFRNSFQPLNQTWEIWECEYRKYQDPLPSEEGGWRVKKLWVGSRFAWVVPSGTALAEKVRIMRRVGV